MGSPKFVIGLILFLHLSCIVRGQSSLYAAAKSGLNLREQPNATATVLTKIPYGAKITKASDAYYDHIATEGMEALWVRIEYAGLTGYVADVYLLPFRPPITYSSDDLTGYLGSFSKEVGRSKKILGLSPEEDILSVERILYENGMVYRNFSGYESESETIWIPGISMHQGFVLARLLCARNELLSTSNPYPGKSVKGTNHTHDITLMYLNEWVNGIRYDWCDTTLCYTVEIRDESGEISITFSSGL